MGRPSKFSPEVRERAVRLVLEQQDKHESQWAAIASIARCSFHGTRGVNHVLAAKCQRCPGAVP